MEYFTPEIEDIKKNYQCEYVNNGAWMNVWVGSPEMSINNTILFIENKPEHIRVSFITKEQIEGEGWYRGNNFTKTTMTFTKDYYQLYFNTENRRIRILDTKKLNTAYTNETKRLYFNQIIDFICPSINEFRTISKLLKI